MSRKQSKTCLAVIKNARGKLVMAGDRRVSWDFSQAQAMPRPKIIKRDGLLLGGTGDGYLCSLIVNIMDIPVPDTDNIDDYMFRQLRQAIYKILKIHGFVEEHGLLRIPSNVGTEIVVGIQGKVYQINIDNPNEEDEGNHLGGLISIDEVNTPYATGCGGALAWGALLESADGKFTAKERLTRALNIAAQVSPGCGDGIDIIGES